MGDGGLAASPCGDTRLNIALYQCITEPVSIIAPVSQQGACGRKRVKKHARANVIAGLPRAETHRQGPPFGIHNGVQLAVQPAFCAPDKAPAPPFLPRRLEAVRWALRWVASIMMTSVSRPSAAISVRIRANMPKRLHRTQRLYSVLCGPYSAGASRQRNPLRLMKIIPLNTRLSSTRGTPWDSDQNGLRRSICASVNQNKSAMQHPLAAISESIGGGESKWFNGS